MKNNIIDTQNKRILGSSIIDERTGKIWFKGAHYNRWFGFIKHLRTSHPAAINCLTGMGTYVPISVIEINGLWDNETFPQYYGDIDFTLRAYNKGVILDVLDDLCIFNDTSCSSYNQEKSISKYLKSLNIIQSRYNVAIDMRFHKKHAKLITWYIGFFLKHIKCLINNIF